MSPSRKFVSVAQSVTAAVLVLCLSLSAARAADARRGESRREEHRGYALDNRYQHGQYYPQRGAAFRDLPGDRRRVDFHGTPYYFHGGAWYRPYGPRYLVIAPPFGIGIDLLPPFYTTVWFGGVPYYYADGTYYLWHPEQRQYVVSEPPAAADAAATQAPAGNDLYAYPKNGQNDQQQATDRYECHGWAASQSGFDPTQPLGGVSSADADTKRADYARAQRACLEGRGYSVN